MTQETSERVVEKSVTVSVPVERAFEVFTEEIGTWWPLRTHAVDTEQSETVVMEGRVGGRLFERTPSGEEHVWGTLVAWEPPSRVIYSWHPGRGEETAQEVEVTSRPEGDGTRVDIRHYGLGEARRPARGDDRELQRGLGQGHRRVRARQREEELDVFIHPDIALRFAAERRRDDEAARRGLRNRPLPDGRVVRARASR